MLTSQLKAILEQEGYKYVRYIEGRGVCGILEFIFTVGICYGLDEIGREGRWCYAKENVLDAMVEYANWDGKGDPRGSWIKYKGRDGERTNDKLK